MPIHISVFFLNFFIRNILYNFRSTLQSLYIFVIFAGLVSPQKWLRGGVTFLDEIPRGPTGKILRQKLKQQYNIM